MNPREKKQSRKRENSRSQRERDRELDLSPTRLDRHLFLYKSPYILHKREIPLRNLLLGFWGCHAIKYPNQQGSVSSVNGRLRTPNKRNETLPRKLDTTDNRTTRKKREIPRALRRQKCDKASSRCLHRIKLHGAFCAVSPYQKLSTK